MSESFRKEQFDGALRDILADAKKQGKTTCLVVSRDLHKRVVGGGTPNRMVMACNAMWKVWEEQGRDESKIIHTTPSDKSSTIELDFFTDIEKHKNDPVELIVMESVEQPAQTREPISKIDNLLKEARKSLEERRLRHAGIDAGIALEDIVKRLCQKKNIKPVKKDEKRPTMSDYIYCLGKSRVVNKEWHSSMRHCAGIRNKCAHSLELKIKAEAIEEVIGIVEGVKKTFL